MIVQIRLGISNVFLVLGPRPVLIDTGRPSDASRLLAALAHHNVRPADLALILLSHGHWDHAGGAAALRLHTSAPVAMHRGDLDAVRCGDQGSLCALGWAWHLLGPMLPTRFPAFEPDILLEGGEPMDDHGLAADIVSLPGHSAGSIGIFFRDHSVMVGDIVFGGYLGGRLLSGRANLHYCAEDPVQLRHSLRELAEREPRQLYLGHGGPIDGADFRLRLPALLRKLGE
jgi:glyoxylase-like metal-dependent hydrolase (beta-lactamase superfamily II)